MKTYNAPWSASLITISGFTTLLSLAITVLIYRNNTGLIRVVGLLPIGLVLGSACFMIRSYTIDGDMLLIQRLFTNTRVSLRGQVVAEFAPEVMRHSRRHFGNGGLFSYSGVFINKTLGEYRAYVTDGDKTVILRVSAGTIVISPEAPEEFVHDVNSL